MATDLSKRGFLKLFGQLAGGAMALSVLPDLGVAKDLVGSTVLWTPGHQITEVPVVDQTNALIVTVSRFRDTLPLLSFALATQGAMHWRPTPGEGFFMKDGELNEIIVTTRTYSTMKQDKCLTTVSGAGQISSGWMKG